MGTRRRLRALLPAGLFVLVSAGMPTAAVAEVARVAGVAPSPPPAAAAASSLGGPELASHGVVVSPGSPELPSDVTAGGWLVADLDTGAVLGARDAHGRYAPASALKMLTAVTLLPELPPSRRVVPTFDDINVEGTRVGLVERVAYPVSELFTAMLTVSGNDAANALATAAGGLPRTVAGMNLTARRLQALDTHAANPSGLDAPGQISTPYDLALIARAGMARPDFRRYVSTRAASVSAPGGRRIATFNHNKLLESYPGAIGIKNGYTTRAQATFAGAATRDGHTLVVTLMRAQPRYWPEAGALLDWGFAALARDVQPVGTLVDPVPPAGSTPSPTPVGTTPAPVPPAAAANNASGVGREALPASVLAVGVVAAGLAVRRRRSLLRQTRIRSQRLRARRGR